MDHSSPNGERQIEGELELELREVHKKIICSETRLDLMKRLLELGLCTRDIYSFACSQADLCDTVCGLNETTIRSAMRGKIRDIIQTLKNYHRLRRKKEMELLKAMGGRSWKLLKKIKSIKESLQTVREDQRKKYEKKIAHYEMKMDRLKRSPGLDELNKAPEDRECQQSVSMDGMNKTPEGGDEERTVGMDGMNKTTEGGGMGNIPPEATVIPTLPPRNLEDFTTSSIFNAPEDLPKPIKPLGPFITSEKIKLSKGEIKLLSKDPKYSLIFPPTQMKVSIETERMAAKVRYNEKSERKKDKESQILINPDREKQEDNYRITDIEGVPIDWRKKKKENNRGISGPYTEEDEDPIYNSEELSEVLKDEKLASLYFECKDRYVHDPVNNTIDFTTRRATDYKLNKNVILPKPMDSSKELQCELRRSAYLKAFDEYQNEINEMKRISGHNSLKKLKKQELNKEKEKKKKKNGRDPINLSKEEIGALESLKERIKNGEIMVCQTDKSSRFAVLTKEQYLRSGRTHTEKDQEISWKEVKYMQGQINAHVWWLTHIFGYATKTDQSRMMKNLQNHSPEVPAMALLVKDHKKWNSASDIPVPSRPVVSGNKGVNTHLSEIISEILEPMIPDLGGGEISSTEEALYKITEVNKSLDDGSAPDAMNVLHSLIEDTMSPGNSDGHVGMDSMNKMGLRGEGNTPTPNIRSVGMNGMNKVNSGGEGNTPTPKNVDKQSVSMDGLNESDILTVETLTSLFQEGGILRGEIIGGIATDTLEEEPVIDSNRKNLKRGDIRQYFHNCIEGQDTVESMSPKYRKWCEGREQTLRKKAEKSTSFNDSIRLKCEATKFWGINNKIKRSEHMKSGMINDEISEDQPPPPIQDFSTNPVMIGGDAVALYPSMDELGTTELVAQAVMKSKINFRNIDLKHLLIYLFLTLGGDMLSECGLGDFIPKRVKWIKTRARSLSSKINRNMDNWSVNLSNISCQEKRMLIALCLKVSILALLDSTCYSFGSKIFKQKWGAGIGLRASACMAKVVMGLLDRMWAQAQSTWNLNIYLYFRYIDDMRIFLHPISKGWRWTDKGWMYSDEDDNRSNLERTKEELAKSFNAVTDFIQFTTEGEDDFANLFLPTLDFQTKVQDSGKILYKFYTKPMANNLTIQYGTGLAKSTVFSSLRQELIRRMLNCSVELEWDERLQIVEEYVQLLINSGHKYPFIKAIILQAITRYKYMVRRSKLDHKDPKYRPLYRSRCYDSLRRKLTKMTEVMTWFKGGVDYDIYRNDWKKLIKRRKNRDTLYKRRKKNVDDQFKVGNGVYKKKDVICTMFVPASKDSMLFDKIVAAELKLGNMMDWDVKILEQSGIPLSTIFIPEFPLSCGCPKGHDCICANTAVKCGKKGIIYRASCLWCKRPSTAPPVHSKPTNSDNLLFQESVEVSPDVEVRSDETSNENGRTVRPCDMNKTVGMDGMNRTPEGEGDKRAVAMDEMNKTPKGGGIKRAVVMDEMNKTPMKGGYCGNNGNLVNAVYIGETSRPFRERISEHLSSLKNGSYKSFIIAHWMEEHESSMIPPVFKWEIIDGYKDALRRQLGEGLYILKEGGLNRKNEFNSNAICRLQATMNECLSDKEMQQELEARKSYNMRIRKFVVEKKRNDLNGVFCGSKNNNVAVIDVDVIEGRWFE